MAKRTRATAASAAVAAGGALAAGKVVHDLVAERAERKRARRFRLQPDEAVADGIRRVVRGQLDLAVESIDGGDSDPEAIHQARKALKRVRAVLRLCRPRLGKERFRQENTILRDAGRALSGARDAQVLIETLDGLREPLGAELPDDVWSRFREALVAETRMTAGHDGARGRGNVVTALVGVRARVDVWQLPDDAGPEALADGLQRVYAKARAAHAHARRRSSAENLHELRKRTKDVWHAGQLLGAVRPKRMRKLRRRAHRMSDVLGDDHDLGVLLDKADAMPELFGPGERELLRALIERRQRVLERDALERSTKLYRRKPRKLVRRLVPA